MRVTRRASGHEHHNHNHTQRGTGDGAHAGHPGGARRSGRPARPRVSLVVPTLNEARNLREVMPRLPQVHEVILVDGGSVDDTVAVARELMPDITVVTQTRRGKGNALACGFAEVTGDVVVMFDADGSADPEEIPRFVAALVAGADFAKGSRFREGGGSVDITPIRRLGNGFLNRRANALFGTAFTDLCYGYNAFWADVVPVLALPEPALAPRPDGAMHWGDGFEIETMINCRIAAADLRITEVPSVELERIWGVSNLNAVKDGLRVLRTMYAERRRAATPTGTHRAEDPVDPVDRNGDRDGDRSGGQVPAQRSAGSVPEGRPSSRARAAS
ncbi:glycosyltransferase family 2 protein [Nocardioides donggukensis]|uniref:Glycosyltransferase family 2 protein n=1 Tax=Nocardioides donggukensis TaxID=2774019 RepID=A0A927K2L6_9ACTN|nr:glycosyltransferase family 2 protein [Nocardioides donggukensis]MBD8869382.1 glycosyltransferase family 2 protein [Nocardioides donggukensis]